VKKRLLQDGCGRQRLVPANGDSRLGERNAAGSRPSLRVRLATAADRPRLIPIINAAYSIEKFLGGTRTDGTRLAAMMEKGSILMAEEDSGRPVATIYVELRGNRGYMGLLAVHPERQGLGLGWRMMQEGEAWLRSRGCEAVDILVLSLRTELLPPYRRFGFMETGTEPIQLSRPLEAGFECHGIVMSKKL
jgi:ribosomal protein S18 acetylase RimI-like enzyme